MATKIVEGVNIVREIIKTCPEHQIWLSFNNDSGAAFFWEWWNTEGFDAYQKYCSENEKPF